MRYILIVLSALLMLTGCGIKKEEAVKENKRDLDYAIVSKLEVPQEILEYIESNGDKAYNTTYNIEDGLYILVSYGAMETSGYSIIVEEVSETDENIIVKTKLLGPEPEDQINKVTTTPYIVIKVLSSEKMVVFE